VHSVHSGLAKDQHPHGFFWIETTEFSSGWHRQSSAPLSPLAWMNPKSAENDRGGVRAGGTAQVKALYPVPPAVILLPLPGGMVPVWLPLISPHASVGRLPASFFASQPKRSSDPWLRGKQPRRRWPVANLHTISRDYMYEETPDKSTMPDWADLPMLVLLEAPSFPKSCRSLGRLASS